VTQSKRERLLSLRRLADEALQEAEVLLQATHFAGCVSRAYYAAFYAASAALLSIGLEFGSHSAVLAAFGQHLARGKPFEPELRRVLARRFAARRSADYDPERRPDRRSAQEAVREARVVLEAVGTFLGESGSETHPGDSD